MKIIWLNDIICDIEYGECEFPIGSDSGTLSDSVTPLSQGQTWCVTNKNVGANKLQAGLEYACGVGGVDCGLIQSSSTCYNPNTLEAHPSYAFNNFYQKNAHAVRSCNFNGAAYVVDQPPHKYHKNFNRPISIFCLYISIF